MQDNHVVELESAEAGNQNTISAAGAWTPDERGFYHYVTLPPAPVFTATKTPVAEESSIEKSLELEQDTPVYNVHIPFSVPQSMPEAIRSSFWLVAKQGARHMSRFQMPKLQVPKFELPKFQPITIQAPKLNLPAIRPLPVQNKKADYNSTIKRMQRVQSELKSSWQNFEPTGVASEKETIKNQWNLPRIPSQPEMPVDIKSKPRVKTASARKAEQSAVSEPAQPVFKRTTDVDAGLDDIFPVQITSFFMNEKDAIRTEQAMQEQPRQIFDAVLVTEPENIDAGPQPEIQQAVVQEPVKVPETLEEIQTLNLPAVIEPGYHLPELCKDVQETELAVQLMLRNNKILSNSINALAHRYFVRNDAQEVSTFLY